MVTIIHIISDANLSGAPLHVARLCRGLGKQQIRSVVIGPSGPATAVFHDYDIAYHIAQFPSKFAVPAIYQLRRQLRAIMRVIREGEAIIHCHGVRAGLFGRLAARGIGCPVVYTEHLWTGEYKLPNRLNHAVQLRLLRRLDRFTTKTIAVSDAVARFLVDARVTTPNKVIRIYNGIELPENPQLNPPHWTIGSIGSLTWQKNYAYLLEAIAEVKKKQPDVCLEIIGAGAEQELLKQKAQQLDLEGSVAFLGALPHAAVLDRMQHWGLYIQCSKNESFGLAVVEAIAHGVPALVSKVGSLPEVVGTPNALFTLGEPHELAQKIEHIFQDSRARSDLWHQELRTVQQFRFEYMVAEHATLYRSLISKQKD